MVLAAISWPFRARLRLDVSRDASRIYDVEVVVSMLRIVCTRCGFTSPVLAFRLSTELCVMEPPSLCTLVAAKSAPACMADTGRSS
ncbi:hypothetical protein D3C86_2071310 [compost metagenome]